MGICSSRVVFAMASRLFALGFRSLVRARLWDLALGRRISLTLGRVFEPLHHDSAFGDGAREAGPFFASAFLEPSNPPVRRPGSAEADQSSANESSGTSVGGEIR
jgi:hypothetical protein